MVSNEERHLAELQRSVQDAYKHGEFVEALELAKHCVSEMKKLLGPDHPATASAHNNVGIMSKRLGKFDQAIDAYLLSVSAYRSSAGEKHPQHISVMSNLGLCFQAAALAKGPKRGLDRGPLLERAVETLGEVVRLREASEISYSDSGGSHTTTLAQSRMHHAIAKFYAQDADSNSGHLFEDLLSSERPQVPEATAAALDSVELYLEATLERFGDRPSLEVATALNNKGFLLKCVGLLEEAKPCYEAALSTRSKLLGAAHQDTIAAKHNLAELLLASGRDLEAAALQQEILDTLGVEDEGEEKGPERPMGQ